MTGDWTILRVLDATRDWFAKRGIESARLDAELILARALGISRLMLYARFDQPLSEEERAAVRALMIRRGKREPIAYILGEREFWSLDLKVDARVLIPRPDTEVLVEVALERLTAQAAEAPRIVDVGTGSGAVALALAHEKKNARVQAVDISPDALEVARANATRLGLADRVEVVHSDLLAGVRGPFDLVVANLPYIRKAEIARLDEDVRAHEPHLALDGGADGLDLVRHLIRQATSRIVPRGAVALEAGFDQLDQVAELLRQASFEDVTVRRDYGGQPRVASGLWPGPP